MAWTFAESNSRKPIPIPPQKIACYIRVQGDCTEVFRTMNYSKIPSDKVRGTIKGFSNAARMRMIRTAAQIDWKAVGKCHFITLTYPDSSIQPSYRDRSKSRYLFHRHMEKHLSKETALLWRTEWEKRKSGRHQGMYVPHFHMIACGVNYLDQWKVREWWRSVLKREGPLATECKRIEGVEGVVKYVCAYCAAPDSLDRIAFHNSPYTQGRQWGILRNSLIPRHRVEVLRALTSEEVAFVQSHAIDVYPRYDPKVGGGFTLFGNERKKEILDGLGITC